MTEGTIQWVLYERLKKMSAGTQGKGGVQEWMGMLGSAGTAKCVASLITYPHEVCFHQSPAILLSLCIGYSNTATTTKGGRTSKVQRTDADTETGYQRRGRSVAIRRAECAPTAGSAKRSSDVLDIRGYPTLGPSKIKSSIIVIFISRITPHVIHSYLYHHHHGR